VSRKTEAIIHLNAFAHNLSQVRVCAPKAKVLAMVKANAYGHGLIPVARALVAAGVDALGVAVTQEALQIREAGIIEPIWILEGFFDKEELEVIAREKLIAVLHDAHQLTLLKQYPLSSPLSVWIKVDTGMHRLGFHIDEIKAIVETLRALPWVHIAGLMTHFSDADVPSRGKTKDQIQLFNTVAADYALPRCAGNSAGIMAFPEAQYEWVRPGLMLYGVNPLQENTKSHPLKVAMTLQSQLISVKKIKQGATVSYGSTWQAPHDTTIGVVAIGYGDGYPIHAKVGTPVLIQGQRYPIVGRVCMDMLVVDLGQGSHLRVADSVTLWGESLSVTEIAECADTISWDLLCSVMQRVTYHYQPF